MLCTTCSLSFAQQQSATPAAPESADQQQTVKPGEKPLTPAELREQQIRLHDPLAPGNPLLGDGQSKPKEETESTTAQPSRGRKPVPLRGSVAESNQGGAANGLVGGPEVVDEDNGLASRGYAGPAVLSRSYTIAGPASPQSLHWEPSIGFTESYDTGLAQGSSVPGGPMRTISANGYGATWSLFGKHLWKRDLLGVSYLGSYNKYGYSGYSGANQTMKMDLVHQFSRHFSLDVSSSGSIQSQNYALLNQFAGADSAANTNLAVSPTTQILDQGIRQWTNQASLVWQKSNRLSFNAGGGVFFVERTGIGGIGNTGYQAQGEMDYRYTRKTTVGLYYSYTTYTFSQKINVANFHTVGGIYSYAFNRTTQLRLRAGVSEIENEGQQLVSFDPTIAALLGRSQGIVESYHRSATSDISAQLARDFGRHRTASISYTKGVSPGNGLIQTSTQELFAASFSMVLRRDYRLIVSGGHTALAAVALTAYNYGSNFFDVNISKAYRHGMTGNFTVDYRKLSLTGQPGLQSQLRISTGISWSPGENWLKSW